MQMYKLGTVATTVYTDHEDMTCVRYHETDVVRFDHEKIILDSGGWRTATTKARMNQASNQFGLGFSVNQKNGEWFVNINGETIEPFEDDMIIYREQE